MAERKISPVYIFAAIFFGVGIVLSVHESMNRPHVELPKIEPTPEELAEAKRTENAYYQGAAGAKLLMQAMRDPSSFSISSIVFTDKSGALCYEYRAKNGFGGMSVEHAVMLPDGANFYAQNTSGFAGAWQKYCNKQLGREIVSGVLRAM